MDGIKAEDHEKNSVSKTIEKAGGGEKIEAIETLKISINIDDIQESGYY